MILPEIPLQGHMVNDETCLSVINLSKSRRERPDRHITSEDWATDSQLIYLPISPHLERWEWFSSNILQRHLVRVGLFLGEETPVFTLFIVLQSFALI